MPRIPRVSSLSRWMLGFLLAPAAAVAQLPTLSGPGSGPPGQRPSSPLTVLYDQTDNPANSDITAQDFETTFDAYDAEAADDFVVPAGQRWSVESLFIDGEYGNGPGPAASFNVTFFADSSGLPGVAACTYTQIPYSPVGSPGDIDITLPSPCVLLPGTYWVDVQARQDFSPNGQWFWQKRTPQSNQPAVWRNPGGGFGTGCTTFTPILTCIPTQVGLDLIFSLSGTVLPAGVIPPPPPECAAATGAFVNSTPTPIPDVSTVTSDIVVSGTGPYLWDVNMSTLITHTYNADLDVTLTSPAGTVVTITTGNGGSANDVFNGTTWDDDAGDSNPPGPVTMASFVDGVAQPALVPEEAMAAFQGENPNGTWTLTITDTAADDVGSLNGWALEVTTLPQLPGWLQASTGNGTAMPIPDLGSVNSLIAFPGLFSHVCGVTISTDITHPINSDLVLNLSSPAGTTVTLSNRRGGPNADGFAGTYWYDSVGLFNPPGPVTDTVFTSGVAEPELVPEEAMGAFLGENPTGNWTLSVADAGAGNTGTLNGWSLAIANCTCNFAAPNTPLRVDEHASSGSSNLNGVFELGERALVEPSWMNPGTTPFLGFGFGSNLTGPPGPTYNFVDGFAVYGTISPSATGNCFDATGDCFETEITGARPAQHFDATFTEQLGMASLGEGTVGGNPIKTWTLHVGESFADVPTGNLFYKFIENIFHNGVTGGCSPTDYCPGNNTLRKQMAVFVLKSLLGSGYTPPTCTGVFTDVPCPGPFTDWIEDLYTRGVVAGCGAGPTYCPDNPVLRQQMAVFLLKTLLGSSYVPPGCTGIFGDVPCPSLFADWIEDLANRGIAAGCGGGNYCPTNPTTRGQMAPFLVKTFSLLLYGP